MTRLCCLLLAAALPGAVAAQTYKWVDGKGQTHYTQVPPKSGNYELIGPPPAPTPAPNQEALNESLADAAKKAPEQQKAADKEAEEQARRQENCRQALERIAYLEARTPRRLGVKDEQGNTSRMSEEEFRRQRAAEQERADKNCG